MHLDTAADEVAQNSSILARLSDPLWSKVAVVTCFAVLFALAGTRNVNWDEFYFLSHVHAHFEGRLDRPLQTVFVHGFGWLAAIPGNEMAQITVARLVMTALLAITCLSIFRMSLALSDRRSAWIAVAAFLTAGFTIAHGASFRADPIAAAALMASLAIMLTGRMSGLQIMAVAVLSAAALLVTVKAALYLPAYLAVLAWRIREPGIALKVIAAGALGLVVAFVLFLLHSAAIDAPADRTASANLQGALSTALLQSGLFPRGEVALLWALLSVGSLVLIWFGTTRSDTRLSLLLIAFAAPLLLSLLFYRNAFHYFFPFITPPMMVAVAVGAARLGRGPVLGALVAIMLTTGAGQAICAASEDATAQRATLAEVHRLFPEPVPYIDQNAMVASFPRDVFFMSTWGVADYRAAGKPLMADLIERTQPPLLITNRWALRQAMTAPPESDHVFSLLPADEVALRETYVHYSGTIWLAGRELTLDGTTVSVNLPVRGKYRVIADAPTIIDGTQFMSGETVEITGPITIDGPAGTRAALIWDTGHPLTFGALTEGPLYAEFWKL